MVNKKIFLAELRARLQGLPRRDIDERVSFYSEMIDDRISDGLSEREAILEIGSAATVAEQIKREAASVNLKESGARVKRSRGTVGILLLILGSPLWISLVAAAFAVCVSLYAVLWSVAVSLWAVFVSFAATSLGCIVLCPVALFIGNGFLGAAFAGSSAILAGLAIFAFFGCREFTRLVIVMTKRICRFIKDRASFWRIIL